MGDPTTAQRKLFAKMGIAMPDGSYYIRNGSDGASDLDNAIRAVGRGEDGDPSSGDPIRVHIIKRAKALGLSSKIPDTWNADGSLKHEGGIVGQFIEHYGVKGMHWNSTLQAQADDAAKQLAAQRAGKVAKGAKKVTQHQLHLLHIAYLVHTAAQAQQAHNKKIMGLKTLARQVKGVQKTVVASKISKAQTAHQASMAAIASQVQETAAKLKELNASHSDDQVGDFLEHFGVKGMHWGVRHTREELEGQASAHENVARAHVAAAAHVAKQQQDLQTRGVKSDVFKKVYGNDAPHQTDWQFYGKNGQSKAAALNETSNNLRILQNQHVRAANRHSAKAVKLRAKAASLDHGALDDGEPFEDLSDSLEHFGVKGMHWGVRKARTAFGLPANGAPAKRAKKAAKIKGALAEAQSHEDAAKQHADIAFKAAHYYDEVVNKGANSKAVKAAYGADTPKLSDAEFRAKHGITKDQAVAAAKSDLIKINNAFGSSAANHASAARYLRSRAAKLKQGDDDGESFGETGDTLLHFGVKGMHWGVRKARSSEPSSADHATAQAIRAKAKAGGGIHALSNDELQTLVTRLNLEQNHARLTANPGSVKKGHQFVKEGLGIGKTALDLYNTGKQVKGAIDEVSKKKAA